MSALFNFRISSYLRKSRRSLSGLEFQSQGQNYWYRKMAPIVVNDFLPEQLLCAMPTAANIWVHSTFLNTLDTFCKL